jgi:hypothetical protein
MTTTKYWQEDASYRGADADELFAECTRQKRAKQVCEGCPVRIDCLVEALDNRTEWGVGRHDRTGAPLAAPPQTGRRFLAARPGPLPRRTAAAAGQLTGHRSAAAHSPCHLSTGVLAFWRPDRLPGRPAHIALCPPAGRDAQLQRPRAVVCRADTDYGRTRAQGRGVEGFGPEDIAAMLEEGGLPAFLRLRIRPDRTTGAEDGVVAALCGTRPSHRRRLVLRHTPGRTPSGSGGGGPV